MGAEHSKMSDIVGGSDRRRDSGTTRGRRANYPLNPTPDQGHACIPATEAVIAPALLIPASGAVFLAPANVGFAPPANALVFPPPPDTLPVGFPPPSDALAFPPLPNTLAFPPANAASHNPSNESSSNQPANQPITLPIRSKMPKTSASGLSLWKCHVCSSTNTVYITAENKCVSPHCGYHQKCNECKEWRP